MCMSMSMSKTNSYLVQFHAKHLNCAWCTSISRTGSSSMCAERHRCLQSVHAVRQAVYSRRSDHWQRRSADQVCYVDTAERSSGAGGWSSMSTGDVGDRSAAVDQIPWCFVLQTPTDHDSQLILHAFNYSDNYALQLHMSHMQAACGIKASCGMWEWDYTFIE